MSRKLAFSVIASLLAIIFILLFKFVISGKTEAGSAADPRTVIVLESGERALILQEMRQFLIALQGVNQALAKDDFKAAADSARSMGRKSANEVSGSLMGKLPIEFKRLGLSVHNDFDSLADELETRRDARRAAAMLGETLQKCVACHAGYQIPNRN